jgi:uncharacterized protein YebE (UPF0316 family)
MLASALLIFVLRVLDITAATLRMMMVVRGQKLAAWILGFIQALFFVLAIQAVLSNLSSWLNILGYAAGFATGTVVGMKIEELMAIGHVNLRIISSSRGPEIAEYLREKGFAVTELPARGKDGMVSYLNCAVYRKDVDRVERLIEEKDGSAFITAGDVRPIRRGFWKS